MYVVDEDTGKAVSEISRDKKIDRLKYETVEDYEKRTGEKVQGENVKPDDWVDVYGKKIDKNASTDELFNRIPVWKDDTKTFDVEEIDWNRLKQETDEYNKGRDPKDQISTEVMHARIERENKILQARGSSLFHARDYKNQLRERSELLKLKKKYEKLKEGSYKGKEKDANFWLGSELLGGKTPSPDVNYEKVLGKKLDFINDTMRHIHEASGSADVQAKELQESLDRLRTVEEYGLDKTAETVAEAALYAKQKYDTNKKKYGLEKPLYVAPENWDPNAFGSHPEEYAKAIRLSREKAAKKLMHKGYSEEDAKDMAKTHIKGTLDIGHLNIYRKHMQKLHENETEEEKDKRFDDWMMEETEKLLKEGLIGHIHVSDNFGYDDEHLSPGDGNVPIRRFLKKLKEKDMDDIIVEAGSFNGKTAMTDTLSYINSPVFGSGRRTRFNMMRNAHFGANAPGFFIAGSYAPSNQWKMWTDVPLE